MGINPWCSLNLTLSQWEDSVKARCWVRDCLRIWPNPKNGTTVHSIFTRAPPGSLENVHVHVPTQQCEVNQRFPIASSGVYAKRYDKRNKHLWQRHNRSPQVLAVLAQWHNCRYCRNIFKIEWCATEEKEGEKSRWRPRRCFSWLNVVLTTPSSLASLIFWSTFSWFLQESQRIAGTTWTHVPDMQDNGSSFQFDKCIILLRLRTGLVSTLHLTYQSTPGLRLMTSWYPSRA